MTTPPSSPLRRGTILGAAFLMATSAVGPGFLTQTALFTEKLLASFAFAILVSIIIDLGAQLSIWRVVAVSGQPAQQIANRVLPGLGTFLTSLICLGGLAFNIGNIAGAGLGLEVLTELPVKTGAVLSAIVALTVFWFREANKAMDRFTVFLGAIMISLTAFVAISSSPAIGEAALRAIAPDRVDILAIVTIVGGTVGGYISFAGAHRLLDADIVGVSHLPQVDRSAATAIGVASIMRVLLFLAAFGVVAGGATLDPGNPAASVFQIATGVAGYRIFGLVMWAAAITSVVGSAYTSITFLQGIVPGADKYRKALVTAFIVVSTLIFVLIGRPVALLVGAGALNGLILPLALGTILLASRSPLIVGAYRHPKWLLVMGVGVVAVMGFLGGRTLVVELPTLFR